MKNLSRIAFFVFFLIVPRYTEAQLALDKELFDSLENRFIPQGLFASEFCFVIKMNYEDKRQKEFYFTFSPICLKRELPSDVIGLYKKSNHILFIKDTDILIDTSLKKSIIYRNDEEFNRVANSFLVYKREGDEFVIFVELEVYHVKKLRFNKKYIVKREIYAPYTTAPKNYWPVDKYFYPGFVIDELNFLEYKDAYGRLNSFYYEMMKEKVFKFKKKQ